MFASKFWDNIFRSSHFYGSAKRSSYIKSEIMKLGTALAALPFLSVASSRQSAERSANIGGLRRLQDDKDKDEVCAGEDERSQQCGAGNNRPEKCCPGFECKKDGNRCQPRANTPTATPTISPTAATGTPTTAPVISTPKPTNHPTERPTMLSERKVHRSWQTILTADKMIKVMEGEPAIIKRFVTPERDPFKFTEMPSAMPSSMPSAVPSASPSVLPSAAPTSAPSWSPTMAPTPERRDSCRVRMYYEKKWCWHDDVPKNSDCKADFRMMVNAAGDDMDMKEGKVRVLLVRLHLPSLSHLTISSLHNSNILLFHVFVPLFKCQGDEFIVRGFTVRPKSDDDRCWTRRGDSGIRLEKCKEDDDDQKFEGVCMKKPHQITPKGNRKWCLTSGHEPRDGERMKFQECNKVDNSNTHLWIRD